MPERQQRRGRSLQAGQQALAAKTRGEYAGHKADVAIDILES
jgi:hypothetical protein